MKTEFIHTNKDGKQTRFTPKPVTYNGVQGHLWKTYSFERNCWIFERTVFHPNRTTRVQIIGDTP